jgi:ABC-type Zn uptake system ZnuABC Zn-binding protein ZnuA
VLKVQQQKQMRHEDEERGVAKHVWLTPVILATQVAEIRRITV